MKMLKLARWLGIGAITLSLLACASIPSQVSKINEKLEVQEVTETWNDTPALTIIRVPGKAEIQVPGDLPDKLQKMVIEANTGSRHTLDDLMAALGQVGIPGIISDPEVGQKVVPLKHFKGKVSDLLRAVSRALDISFAWSNGVLIAGKSGEYIYSLVQNEEVGARVVEDLTKLGATNISFSMTSGLLKFDSNWKDHDNIKEYMSRVTEGMGNIGLQVSVITVSLNKTKSTGFDWSTMQANFRGGLTPITLSDNSSSSSNDFSNDNGDDDDDSVSSIIKSGVISSIGGDAVKFIYNRNNFTLSGLIDTLRQYGETRTSQNVLMRTLSGTSVAIKAGNSIPYVAGLSSSIANNTGVNTTSSVDIQTVETGIDVNILPNLESRSGIVTMPVDMKIKSLLGFVEVSAGNSAGNFSQPNVQSQELEDIARIGLGDTVVLGGITYSTVKDTRNSLPLVETLPIAHQDYELSREALFIVIRPTATLYRYNNGKDIVSEIDAINNIRRYNGVVEVKEAERKTLVTQDKVAPKVPGYEEKAPAKAEKGKTKPVSKATTDKAKVSPVMTSAPKVQAEEVAAPSKMKGSEVPVDINAVGKTTSKEKPSGKRSKSASAVRPSAHVPSIMVSKNPSKREEKE